LERGAVSIEAPERCTRPPALIVSRSARFRSSLRKAALSTVRSAIRSTDRLDEIDTRQGQSEDRKRIIALLSDSS
jgi:hypothetical protein